VSESVGIRLGVPEMEASACGFPLTP